jgi:colicin import membrane protein
MKAKVDAPAYMFHSTESNYRAFFLTYSVSTICHLIFFVVFIVVPGRIADRKSIPHVINVSMVASPMEERGTRKELKTPEKPSVSEITPKPRAKVESQATETVSVVPKKKVKESLKKKTFKSSKVLKSAIDRIEKTVEQTRPDPLKETFERLEQEVEKREAVNHLEPEATKDESGLGARLPAGSGVGPKKTLELINIYRVEIAYRVQKNWAFSGQLAGDAENLQASLVFKVMPNGEIKDIFFTDRSGNSYLDESAYKAIVKANPVDPHPAGIAKPYVDVGLRFTPEGVR